MTRFCTLLSLFLLAGAVIAQAQNTSGSQSSGSTSGDGNSSTAVSSSRVPSNYRIQPKDVIRVEVFQEDELLREVRVNADGEISLPLIGNIRVGNMTVLDAQNLITELYEKDYLVDPQITLLILEYVERRVTVTGQVNQPGPVIIPPEEQMTFSQAIAAARGPNLRADLDNIILTRTMPDGKVRKFTLDWDEIVKDPRKDIVLKDGDIIFVDEDFI